MAELDDIRRHLDKSGRLPAVKLEVQPLGGTAFTLERFNSYAFNSNILIPVDTFSFTFRPSQPKSSNSATFDKIVREGDTVQLTVDGEAIATGYVDAIDIEVDVDGGARISIQGRDLMGFLEDNHSVNADNTIIYSNGWKIGDVLPALLKDTRIRGFETRNMASDVKSLFATAQGESKLASLQRFLDPLNALAWMGPTGKLICGKPSFDEPSRGALGILSMRNPRAANVLNMRIHRAAGQIPNSVLPIWTGNENVQTLSAGQSLRNGAEGPKRLYDAGHKIFRTIVTSAPDAADVKSGLTETQRLIAQGGDYLRSLAARELARENVNELLVTMTVVGHINAQGDPYAADQCYDVFFDAAGLDKKMYLYGVEYALTEDNSQVTHLSFCNINTIVADPQATPQAGGGTGAAGVA